MRNKDTIAEITSETGGKKISMSFSDMLELLTTVIKKQSKKRKKDESEEELENYLLPQDIEDILSEFAPIEHLIKAEEGESADSFVDLMGGLVESTIYTRVRDLSRQRKIERITEVASAQARDSEQTPRYYHPWYRLFIKTPNRAMRLILEREEQTARLVHMQQQIENDELRARADKWEEEYERQLSEQDEEEPEENSEEEPEEDSEEVDGEEPEEEEEVDEIEPAEENHGADEVVEIAPTLPERKRRKRRSKPDEQEQGTQEDSDDDQVTIDEAIETPPEDEDGEDDEENDGDE